MRTTRSHLVGLVLLAIAYTLGGPQSEGGQPGWLNNGTRQAIQVGNLLIPNEGLDAVQEFDPVSRTVVQELALPAPYTYQNGRMLWSVVVREVDHTIVLNVRTSGGNPAVITLSSSGDLLAAHTVTTECVQEMAFDPLDRTQSKVLAGVPFAPRVDAFDVFSGEVLPRIVETSLNTIGIETDSGGDLYVTDWNTGCIRRYEGDGQFVSVFANVWGDVGREPQSLAFDDQGLLYAAANDRIAKYDCAGTFMGSLLNPGFSDLTHVYYNNGDGLLYASNQDNGSLVVLATDGTPVDVINLGGTNPGTAFRIPPLTRPPVVGDQLVAYWQAEGSATESIHGIPGALIGDVSYGAGGVGQCFHFGGGEAQVSVGAFRELTVGGTDFTLEAWVRPQASFRPVITDRFACGNGNWQVYAPPSYFSFWSDGYACPTEAMFYSGVDLPLGAWSFLAVTYDGSEVAHYLNGALAQTMAGTGSINGAPQSIQIGADSCGTTWVGDIDQVALYRATLSPERIAEHYSLGLSGKGYIVLLDGFESGTTAGWSSVVP